MASTGIASNRVKYELAKGYIDLSSDLIRICLMRSGYAFNKDIISQRKNFVNESEAATLTCDAGGQTILRNTGSFVDDGFIIGMQITTDLDINTGPFILTNVEVDTLTVVSGIVNEGPISDRIVSGNDELEVIHGYEQQVLVNSLLEIDNDSDWAIFTCDDVSWTVDGGNIGPTPGAILYDETASDYPIIGYIDFGGEKTASSGTFAIHGIVIKII